MKYIFQLSFLFFPLVTFSQTFKPGIWKSKDSVKLNGLSLPDSEGEECITDGQASDAKASLEKELKKHGCNLTKWYLQKQKLETELNCKNKDMDASGKLSGALTEKSYDLKGEAKGEYKQVLPATAVFHLTGRWVKKCSKK